VRERGAPFFLSQSALFLCPEAEEGSLHIMMEQVEMYNILFFSRGKQKVFETFRGREK
jgi:hypothetical protein